MCRFNGLFNGKSSSVSNLIFVKFLPYLDSMELHSVVLRSTELHSPQFMVPILFLTLFRMAIFGAAHGWGGGAKSPPFPYICHTHPTMMKLGTVVPYLKKIQKKYESRDTLPDFCWHQHFLTGNQQILLYQEMQI